MTDSDPRVVRRFENKFVPEPNSGCWLWTACINDDGYGQIKVARRMVGAHRLSWLLNRGDIPSRQQVLHRCDTPSCVNPDHLFLGTHNDNMRDMALKSRGSGWPASAKFPFKSHCKQGHEFTDENTRHYVRDGRKRRECRACRAAYDAGRVRHKTSQPLSAPPSEDSET